MQHLHTFALVGAAAMIVSCAGSAALASYQPKLIASTTSASTTITVSEGILDAPIAMLEIFVPRSISAHLDSPGAAIGMIEGVATPADYGGLPLALTGTIASRKPDDFYVVEGRSISIAQAADECTGTAKHAAYWVLSVGTADTTFDLPAFVDPASGADTTSASYKITICLAPPDVPFGSAGRAPAGVKITTLSLLLKGGVLQSGRGEHKWRAIATPYTPESGKADKSSAIEIQWNGN